MKKAIVKKTKKVKKKAPLTPQDLVKRDHFLRTRSLFRLAGFSRISGLTDKEFTFRGSTCDFDDVFFFENVITCIEYTVLTSDVSAHLKKKKVVFDKILNHQAEFVEYMVGKFPAFQSAMKDLYDYDQYRTVVVYASRYAFSSVTKEEVPRHQIS